MIKTGAIAPGVTPDCERRLPQDASKQKQAAVRGQQANAVAVDMLDDDVTKRAANKAAHGLK